MQIERYYRYSIHTFERVLLVLSARHTILVNFYESNVSEYVKVMAELFFFLRQILIANDNTSMAHLIHGPFRHYGGKPYTLIRQLTTRRY